MSIKFDRFLRGWRSKINKLIQTLRFLHFCTQLFLAMNTYSCVMPHHNLQLLLYIFNAFCLCLYVPLHNKIIALKIIKRIKLTRFLYSILTSLIFHDIMHTLGECLFMNFHSFSSIL